MLENMFVCLAWFLTFNAWVATGIMSTRTIGVEWWEDIPSKALFIILIIAGPLGLFAILFIWLIALLVKLELMFFRLVYKWTECFNDLFMCIF